MGKGTWDEGVEHLKMFLTEKGISYRTLTAQQIVEGTLESGSLKLLIMPGGESWEYLAELGSVGGAKILGFVEQGNGYLGICAGAFYATSHRDGGFATGPYGIGLLFGTAYDGTAYETPPFIEGMMKVDVLPHWITQGQLSLLNIVMFGGPSFRFSAEEQQKKHLSPLTTFRGFGEPAMVVFNYGRGRVFLSGPHLEIEEHRTNWGEEFNDPDSEWPLLQRVVTYLSP